MTIFVLGLLVGLILGCLLGYNLFKLGLAHALVSNSVKKVIWSPDIFGYRTVKVLSIEDLTNLKVKDGDCFMITMSNVKES
jgi:cell shape-determining protein MreD